MHLAATAALGLEACLVLYLLYDAEFYIPEGLASSGFECGRRDRDATCLEAGGGRASAVDGIDYEHPGGRFFANQTAVFRQVSNVGDIIQPFLDQLFGDLVNGKG
jgi:hypothetical protein